MAKSTNCSGGTFDVTWEGHVQVEETIRVNGGTVFNITGYGESSIIDGGNQTQVLTSVNSTLYVSNMYFFNGLGITGGAIAARKSVVTLKNVEFSNNVANYSGGALSMVEVDSSMEDVLFSKNMATIGGGFLTYNSTMEWSGDITFIDNFAGLNAGGAYVRYAELNPLDRFTVLKTMLSRVERVYSLYIPMSNSDIVISTKTAPRLDLRL